MLGVRGCKGCLLGESAGDTTCWGCTGVINGCCECLLESYTHGALRDAGLTGFSGNMLGW